MNVFLVENDGDKLPSLFFEYKSLGKIFEKTGAIETYFEMKEIVKSVENTITALGLISMKRISKIDLQKLREILIFIVLMERHMIINEDRDFLTLGKAPENRIKLKSGDE